LPSRKSFFAASTVDLFGMMISPPVTEGGMLLDSGQDAGTAVSSFVISDEHHRRISAVRGFPAAHS
jgi:hypothetical protein